MEPLTPQNVQSLLKAIKVVKSQEAINILQDFKNGKPLTPARLAVLNRIQKEAENLPSEPHPKYGHMPEWADSKVAAAAMLGHHRNIFSKWKEKFPDDVPRDQTNGRVHLWAWVDFIEKHSLRDYVDEDDPQQNRKKAEARKSEAQAALFEHKLKRVTGEVVPMSVVTRNFTLAMLQIKNEFMRLGNTLAAELRTISDEAVIKQIIDMHVRSTLEALADHPHNGFVCPECKHVVRLEHEC